MSADWFEKVVLSLMALFVLSFLVGITRSIFWLLTPYGSPFIISAHVKNLSYHGSRTSTGIGMSANGSPVVTFNATSAEFQVILVKDDGGSWIVDNEKLFNDVEQDEHLALTIRAKTVWGSEDWDLVSWEKK